MIFSSETDKDYDVAVDYRCICLCEEGISYFFKMLKLVNPENLLIYCIIIPLVYQPLFASYLSQLSNLQELCLIFCYLTIDFIESFVKSIPYMIKLKNMNFPYNPIGVKGFKLLLPHFHLLINKDNELYFSGLNLDDELMILLSEELYKYPNLSIINIQENKNIHSKGLKALCSIFPVSKIGLDIIERKELLIDKDIPKFIECMEETEYRIDTLNLRNLEIDDDYLKSLILLRANELRRIEKFDLSYNKLTCKSIEILINNLSSFSSLKVIRLNGKLIGDEGMKILSPHLHLLKDECDTIDCSKMGLSSDGLTYLLDGLKNIRGMIELLDISDLE